MSILITGGAGYIGSHTAVNLAAAGHDLVIVDNLDNSSAKAIDVVQELAGVSVDFRRLDLRDADGLEKVFSDNDVEAVVHFAGLKAVGESVAEPLRYYSNNLGSTMALLEAMQRHNVDRLVFSSSATVYGDPAQMPITESFPTGATNPYGWTKWMIEQILRDVAAASSMRIASLRYFNPIGAHPSGELGEDPRGIPNNLLPFVMQVAVGRREKVSVFGGDYDTHDGTAVRDYIHVVDLAEGHRAALQTLQSADPGCEEYNLGTGVGSTVLEVIAAASEAVGEQIPYEIVDRRPGDAVQTYADPARAREVLGWESQLDLDDMVRDHWNWQKNHPFGFED